MLPDDVERYLSRYFAATDLGAARSLLENAVIHDGTPATPRLLRCALISSEGFVDKLSRQVESLKRDYRDVIVEGEYAPGGGGRMKRVRNLDNPIPDDY